MNKKTKKRKVKYSSTDQIPEDALNDHMNIIFAAGCFSKLAITGDPRWKALGLQTIANYSTDDLKRLTLTRKECSKGVFDELKRIAIGAVEAVEFIEEPEDEAR